MSTPTPKRSGPPKRAASPSAASRSASGDSIAEARAAAQASQRERAAARSERFAEVEADGIPGRLILATAIWSTVIFAVLCVLAVISYDPWALALAGWSVALFVGGVVVFAVAFWFGAQRSRTEMITVGAWFWLSGSASQRVRVRLLVPVGVQAVLGLVAALATTGAARQAGDQATKAAFATLVAAWGLALCALWGARYGVFDPRPVRTSDRRTQSQRVPDTRRPAAESAGDPSEQEPN